MLFRVLLLLGLFSGPSLLAKTTAVPESCKPFRTGVPPHIDGILDDEAWQYTIVDTTFYTYNPTYGDTLPQKTLIYLAYDSDYLYFAFHCFDNEPDKIKTSVSQRDQIFSDDWVGLSLDAIGNKQSAYDIFVNANGIQADILSTPNSEDTAPDYVWNSAGRRTADGYQVEIGFPLKSIQYKSGAAVTMGVLFWRKISRLGLSGSFPEIKPGQSSFITRLPVLFENLRSPNDLQLLPSITTGRNQERENPDRWQGEKTKTDFGIGVKYALTSTLNLEATYNPDFSQVESDAYQVEVNQRYPLFFSEKRPFFMDAGSFFNLAGTAEDNNMLTAVHTRKIVDPNWGGRISGSLGRTSYGLLAAEDDWNEYKDDEAFAQQKALFTLARTKYTIKDESYIGAFLCDRELSSGYNRVAAMDINYRLTQGHTITLTHYQTLSNNAKTKKETQGSATVMNYMYFSKPLGIWLALENYEPQFNMETAYYYRSGIRKASGYLGPSFYPSQACWKWIRRINPFLFGYYIHDLNTGQDDQLLVAALRSFTSRQGQIRFDYVYLKEYWQGKHFNQYWGRFIASMQAFKWLQTEVFATAGHGIFYSTDPCLGQDRRLNLSVTLQPGTKLKQSFDYNYNRMNRLNDGSRLYTVTIINSRTTYQFNKYFFLRAIVQYDSYEKKAITDFLASFTLIPGTVLHLGYGSLYEKRDWLGNDWFMQRGKFYDMKRSLFFKASYLWRI